MLIQTIVSFGTIMHGYSIELKRILDMEIDLTVYSVENKRKLETSDHYMYEIKNLDNKYKGGDNDVTP